MTNHSSAPLSEEEKAQYKHWDLPDVSSNKSIPSTAKEKQQAQSEKVDKKAEPSIDAGESIETAEEEVVPLTAEQLQAITDAAEKEGYQAGHEQGLTEGHSEGYDKGYQEGLAQGKQSIIEQCQRLQHITDALMVPLQTEHQYLEVMLVDMVKQLATAVVKRELLDDSQHIMQLVDHALASMPITADKYAIYLNSQDVELVEKHLHAIDKQFTFHIDDDLLPGGCRVETRNTAVDFSVEKRLSQVLDDFAHKRFAVGDVTPTSSDDSESTQEAETTIDDNNKNDNETSEQPDTIKSETYQQKADGSVSDNFSDDEKTDSPEAVTKLSPLEKANLKTDSVADQPHSDDDKGSSS